MIKVRSQRTTILAAAAILALLLLLLSAPIIVGRSRIVCRGCHLMRAADDGLQAGVHAGIDCIQCHAGATVAGRMSLLGDVLARMVPASLGRPERVTGIASPIARNACLACHATVNGGTSTSGAVSLKIDHLVCASETSCASCHGGTAHGGSDRWLGVSVMEECVLCHRDREAPGVCDTCHEGRLEKDRLVVGPWQITHGAQWSSTHGMGTLEYCGTCHPTDYCVQCHQVSMPHPGDWPYLHGVAALEHRAACSTCHQGEAICTACHGEDMPHPEGYLKQHSTVMKDADDTPCFTCHAEGDCGECHANHIHPGGPRMFDKGESQSGGSQ